MKEFAVPRGPIGTRPLPKYAGTALCTNTLTARCREDAEKIRKHVDLAIGGTFEFIGCKINYSIFFLSTPLLTLYRGLIVLKILLQYFETKNTN